MRTQRTGALYGAPPPDTLKEPATPAHPFRVSLGLAALATLLLAVLASPAAGQTVGSFPIPGNPFADPIQPPRPVVVGSGVDELLGLQEQQDDGTWLGTYGTGPYGLSSHLGFADLEHQVQGQWAGYLWSLVVWITRVLVALLGWAFTVDLFTPLAGVMGAVINALVDTIWRPLIVPAIVLGGLWGAWRGLVRQEISTLAEGWLWLLATLAFGFFFFTNPTGIANTVNTFAAKMSNMALGAVASVDPGLCAQGEGKCISGSGPLQEVTDRLWYLYVVKPYVVMEFGDGELEDPYLRQLLDAKTITRTDLAEVDQGRAVPDGLVEAKAGQYRTLTEALRSEGDAFEWFVGRRNHERGMIAGMALVAVLIGGIVLGVIAAGVLLAQLGLLLLFLLAPVFLALGIYPGVGRVIATRWAQLSLGMVIQRIGLSILLAVLLVTSGSIMAAADSAGGWYAAVILHVLLGLAAMLYRKPFLGLLALAAPRPELPRIQLRERVSKATAALGVGFAYAVGRQAVMQEAVKRVTTIRKPRPPAVGPSGGHPRPVGPGGGQGPRPSGGLGLRPGGGQGPQLGGGQAVLSGSGFARTDGTRTDGTLSPTHRLGGPAAAAGRATSGGAHRGPSATSTRPASPGSRPSQATAPIQERRNARHDLHTPYQRDERQGIVEPNRRRRRPTFAEQMQTERAADGMDRARDQRHTARDRQRRSE